MNDIDKLKEKLAAQRLRNEAQRAWNMINNQQIQKNFNDEMVNKTWKYQKIYKFETNPKKGHEFWNVEAKKTLNKERVKFEGTLIGSARIM